MFGFVFWSSLWVVLACIFFSQKSETKFRKNIVMGVTLPADAREHPEVICLLQEFQKRHSSACLLLTVLCAAGAFLQDLTVSILCWAVMLVLILLLPAVLFAQTNQKLKALKQRQNWCTAAPQQIRVDVSAMIDYPKPKLSGYLPPALLCILPLPFHFEPKWIPLLLLGMIAASYCCAMLCYRKKSEAVDSDAERTKALSALRWRNWKQLWLVCAYGTAFVSLSVWIAAGSVTVGTVLIVLCTVAFTGIVMGIELQTRRLQQQLTFDSGSGWYSDEDNHWPYGLFYYNPNDSHVFVNARTGVGSTINLASRGGKIISLLILLLFAGCILLLVSVGLSDKSEIVLGADDQSVYCENGSTRYTVPLSEIEELELLDALPEDLWRTGAVGGQRLFKGSFTGGGMADLRILADPTVPPYLKIKTRSGQFYLFGARDPSVAEKLFGALQFIHSVN